MATSPCLKVDVHPFYKGSEGADRSGMGFSSAGGRDERGDLWQRKLIFWEPSYRRD